MQVILAGGGASSRRDYMAGFECWMFAWPNQQSAITLLNMTEPEFTRRSFLRRTSAGVAGALVVDFAQRTDTDAREMPLRLEPSSLLGSCTRVDGPAVIPGAVWYEAQRENDGL